MNREICSIVFDPPISGPLHNARVLWDDLPGHYAVFEDGQDEPTVTGRVLKTIEEDTRRLPSA